MLRTLSEAPMASLKRPPSVPITRDYLDSSLQALSRDLMQHMTRSVDASEKRLTARLYGSRIVSSWWGRRSRR